MKPDRHDPQIESDVAIVVTLRDALTTAERTLVRHGRIRDTRAMRRALQDAMRGDLVTAIQTLTARTVDALLSDSLEEPDVCVEVFLLHPQGDGMLHS